MTMKNGLIKLSTKSIKGKPIIIHFFRLKISKNKIKFISRGLSPNSKEFSTSYNLYKPK